MEQESEAVCDSNMKGGYVWCSHHFLLVLLSYDTDASWAESGREALELLQAGAAAGIPDLDGPVVRRRRHLDRVDREGHWPDVTAMAVERLGAGALFVRHRRHYRS